MSGRRRPSSAIRSRLSPSQPRPGGMADSGQDPVGVSNASGSTDVFESTLVDRRASLPCEIVQRPGSLGVFPTSTRLFVRAVALADSKNPVACLSMF